MARAKFQTLTEQMFYVLLCLREERCGADVLALVRRMTDDRVSIGSGTLYDLLEQFTREGFIEETKLEGRRRSYRLTSRGEALLQGSTGGSKPRSQTMNACREGERHHEKETLARHLFDLSPGSCNQEAGGHGAGGLAASRAWHVPLDVRPHGAKADALCRRL